MKKYYAILGIVLILGGLVLGAYAYDRFSVSSERYSVADEQMASSKGAEKAGQLETAMQSAKFAADNAALGSKARNYAIASSVAGVILVVFGGILVSKRERTM